MENTVQLIIDGKSYELPTVIGSEGERAIDIATLRKETGLITLDPGFVNTGSCKSAITFMDGAKGILRHRGIPIEQLCEHSSFVETAYLLINDALPTRKELHDFSTMLNDHSLVHEDMRGFFEKFPMRAHPMGVLSAMINALRPFTRNCRTEARKKRLTSPLPGCFPRSAPWRPCLIRFPGAIR